MGLKINLDNRTEFVPNLIATSKVQLDCQDPVATSDPVSGPRGVAGTRPSPGRCEPAVQRQLTLLRQHQQQVLVGQQNELAVAVASALPLALAVLEVDASEAAAVEAEGMALVNYEVVEVGIQPVRGPALFDGPSTGSVCDCNASHAVSLAVVDQNVAFRGHGWLHDAGAGRQWVLPESLAIGWPNAGRASPAQQQDLRDSVDRR